MWYGCWDLNSGPLEEQSVLLITEPSLQPKTVVLILIGVLKYLNGFYIFLSIICSLLKVLFTGEMGLEQASLQCRVLHSSLERLGLWFVPLNKKRRKVTDTKAVQSITKKPGKARSMLFDNEQARKRSG